MNPIRILVLCTGNSARSQIAEALLGAMGQGRIAAASAGSHPAARVNPYAVEVLRDNGIAWEGHTPQALDRYADERFDLVLTVCDHARDSCPVLPGTVAVHWGLPDPAEATDPDQARRAFAATFDALRRRIQALVAEPLENLTPDELRDRAAAVHRQYA